MLLSFFIPALISLSIFFILYTVLKSKENFLEERLNQVKKSDLINQNNTFVYETLRPLLEKITSLNKSINKNFSIKGIETKLSWAGDSVKMTVERYLILKVLGAIAVPLTYTLVFVSEHTITTFLFFLILMVLGYFLPDIHLQEKIKNRQFKIQQELPNRLDLLTVCMSSGLTFTEALKRVVIKTDGELSNEFKIVLQDLRYGKSRIEAFEAMSNRCGVEDVQKLVQAVKQQDTLGQNLSEILKLQSSLLKNKIISESEEDANKKSTKIILPLALFVFPAIIIIILGPALIDIFTAI
ncbi:MAG: type II secretion system F family protein [archaeon]